MDNFNSLILYLCVFSITVSFSYIYQRVQNSENKYRKCRYAFLTIFPMVCLHGFRYGVGTDFFNYYNIFNVLGIGGSWQEKVYAKEPIFLWENKILFKIFEDYQAVVILHAVIISVFVFLAFDYFKNSVSMPLMYMIFLLWIYPTFMNIERQAVAMSIVWFSFRYLIEKKPIKYLIWILVAAAYHNSALVFLLLYCIYLFENKYFRKYARYILITIFVISAAFYKQIFLLLDDKIVLFRKYSVYLISGDQLARGVGKGGFVYAVIFSIPFLLFYKKLKMSKKYNGVYIYMFILYYALFVLGNYFSYAGRLQLYLAFVFIILISMGYKTLSLRNNRRIYVTTYFLLFIAYFIRIYYYIGSGEIFPYHTFWNFHN